MRRSAFSPSCQAARAPLAANRAAYVGAVAGMIEAARWMADPKNLDKAAEYCMATGHTKAVAKAVSDPALAGKTLELGGPEVMTLKEIVELVLRETYRKRAVFTLPWGAADLMGKAGDLMLVEVARRLNDALPENGLTARLGGDEFAVLYDPVTSGVPDTVMAANLITAVSQPFDGFDAGRLGVSIGVHASCAIGIHR